MKTNKKFMILSAIGIVMVVDVHSWTTVSLGTSFFPYNSFFMAMFFFVSGYFFSPQKCIDTPFKYLKHKVMSLLLPYLGWSVFYAFFINLLRWISPVRVGYDFNLWTYVKGVFLSGECFDINAPGYFVIILFYVTVVMIILRKLLHRIWNEYVFTALFCALGVFVVYYVVNHPANYSSMKPLNMLLKVGFSLQFFQLGRLYEDKLERLCDKMNPVILALVSFAVARVLKHYTGNITWTLNALDFRGDLAGVKWYLGYLCPLVTSVLGILLWTSISRLLIPVLGESKLCNYISNHTFGIMMNHIPFMAMLNWILAGINSIRPISGLDVEQILKSSWYRFKWGGTDDFYIFYFIVGIVGACLMCLLVDFLKSKVTGLVKKKRQKARIDKMNAEAVE